MGLETVAYMASPSKNCRRGLDKNYEKIKVVPLKKVVSIQLTHIFYMLYIIL